jgi:hypothetical protein
MTNKTIINNIKFLGVELNHSDLEAYDAYKFTFTYRGKVFEGILGFSEGSVPVYESSFKPFFHFVSDSLSSLKSKYQEDIVNQLLIHMANNKESN